MSRSLYRIQDAEVGLVIRWRARPWRIAETRPVPEADWSDEDKTRIYGIKYGDGEDVQRVGGSGIAEWRVKQYAPWYLSLEPLGSVPPELKVRWDGRVHLRGVSFRTGYQAGRFHDWDILDNWPRVGVCSDCGLLWPCPDEEAAAHADQQVAQMDERMTRTCAHCGQYISRGSMEATATLDTPDGPATVMFHGKKGPCRTAAYRWANAHGKRWVGEWGWSNHRLEDIAAAQDEPVPPDRLL